MGGIIDKITDFIKDMLKGWVLSNLETMFTDVNDKVGTIAGGQQDTQLMELRYFQHGADVIGKCHRPHSGNDYQLCTGL